MEFWTPRYQPFIGGILCYYFLPCCKPIHFADCFFTTLKPFSCCISFLYFSFVYKVPLESCLKHLHPFPQPETFPFFF